MSKDNKKKADNIAENVTDIMTEKRAREILAKIKAEEKDKDKPDLYKEIDGVNYILEEHADEMVDMELTRQLWEHIELVSKKLNISEEEAGKIFDIDDEKELLCLKFHAFTMDTIEQAAEDVIKKYAKKQAAEKKKTAAKKTVAKKTAAKKAKTEEKKTEAKPKKETKAKTESKKEAKPKKEIKAKKETKVKA